MAKTRRERERQQMIYDDAMNWMEEAENESKVKPHLKLPDGVEELFRWAEAKTYRIRVVATVAGKYNPSVKEGRAAVCLPYYAHRNVGANRGLVNCPEKTLSPDHPEPEDCAACAAYADAWARIRRQAGKASKDEMSAANEHKPKLRQVWLIYDLDDKDKGLQPFDASFFGGRGSVGFGEMIKNKLEDIQEGDEDAWKKDFYKHQGGCILKVKCKEDTFEKTTFYKPVDIEFVKTKNDLDPDLLKDLPVLDDMPIVLSGEDFAKLFNQGTLDDEEEAEVTAVTRNGKPKAGKKPAKDEEEEEEEESEEEEEVEVAKGDTVTFTYKGKKLTGIVKRVNGDLAQVKCDDRDDPHSVGLDELTKVEDDEVEEEEEEPEEEEEEAEAPKKGKKGKEKPAPKKSSKDDDDWDDDDDSFQDKDGDEEEEETEDEGEKEDERPRRGKAKGRK